MQGVPMHPPWDWLWPHAVRRWVRPAARRLSKRTVTTECPGMALPFLPHPSTTWQSGTVCGYILPNLNACMRSEPRWRREQITMFPAMYLSVPLPCIRPVQVRIVEAYLTHRKHSLYVHPQPCEPYRMVISYAFAPKSLPCNHLRIPFALVLPRSSPFCCSHSACVAPGPANAPAKCST